MADDDYQEIPMAPPAPQVRPAAAASAYTIGYPTQVGIDIPAEEHERCFGIRWADWKRIKRNMKRVQTPPPSFSTWYNTLLGACVATGLSIIQLLCTPNTPAWAMPLYIVATLATGGLAMILYKHEEANIRRQALERQSEIDEMEEIERRFRPVQEIPTSNTNPASSALAVPRAGE